MNRGQTRLGAQGAPGPPGNTGLLQGFSTSTAGPGFATDTYLPGSAIPLAAIAPKAGAMYRLVFQMSKTAAGTQALAVAVRFGPAGSTSDPARLTFNFTAGTAAIDTGVFEIRTHFRSIGAAAILSGVATLDHQLGSGGLTTQGIAGTAVSTAVSGGFNSGVLNSVIGASVNGGTNFAGTCTLVEALWSNP